MQEEDDLRGLARVMDFMRGVSVLLVAANLYWFCRGALAAQGLVQPLAAHGLVQPLATHGWVQGLAANSGTPDMAAQGWAPNLADKVLLNFHRTAGLFNGTWPSKLFALLLLALSCLGSRGVKSEKITWRHIAICGAIGITLFLIAPGNAAAYTATTIAGYTLLLKAGTWMSRLLKNRLAHDPFNVENESFMQETRLKRNEYSVNLPTKFYYHKRWRQGWINVVNPFRATMVLGTPGSGKSYAVVNNYIKQQIEKGFTLYIYDFKFPDLTEIAYNHLLLHAENYKVTPKFYVINFDDPRRSHRCNPIHPRFMTDISDAYESAYTIMLNLNRTWIQKQGDFFVDSPIILLAAIIWFLKIYDGGRYCTFPHAIELLNKKYADIFTILTSYDQLENYLSPFIDAWQGGAQDQLQGQLASAKIPLSRMISPQLYWVMTGDDFSLDINNPLAPKILCVGNNPDRQSIYSAALGLYNSRIVKLINKKDQLKSGVIIDELPTIYFRGLDNLIATARSNKVAVCLGFT